MSQRNLKQVLRSRVTVKAVSYQPLSQRLLMTVRKKMEKKSSRIFKEKWASWLTTYEKSPVCSAVPRQKGFLPRPAAWPSQEVCRRLPEHRDQPVQKTDSTEQRRRRQSVAQISPEQQDSPNQPHSSYFATLSTNSTWPVTARHAVHVGLISQHANCQLLPFSSLNFRLDFDYLHSEPCW